MEKSQKIIKMHFKKIVEVKYSAALWLDSTLHDDSISDFNHLFLLCNRATRPCGPLENAPWAKFGPGSRVCGPLNDIFLIQDNLEVEKTLVK